MGEEGKIKVLHIITRLDPGGSSINTIETVARLDRDKYDCRLIAGDTCDPDGSIEKSLKDKNIACTFLPSLKRDIRLLSDSKALFQLHALIKKGGYGIVHTHSSKAGLLGRLAAKSAGVPHIVHTPHGHVFHGYFGKTMTVMIIFLERWLAGMTEKIITLTEIGAKDHLDLKIGRPEQFVTIPSGIDIQCFREDNEKGRALRRKLDIADDDYVFGSVARLDPVKGNEYIIKALANIVPEHARARLLLVGDGSEKQRLERLCHHNGVEQRVHFAGHQDDIVPYLSAMDCFVLASLNEGMGRSILEAFACGKPVIASDTGGIPAVVAHNTDGFLFKPKDVDGLARAMTELMAHPEKARVFGKNGKEKIGREFSIEIMVEKIAKLYEELGL